MKEIHKACVCDEGRDTYAEWAQGSGNQECPHCWGKERAEFSCCGETLVEGESCLICGTLASNSS